MLASRRPQSRSLTSKTLGSAAGKKASEEDLKQVKVPIGLDIGARSYEEIALSIMAEIVKCTKGGSGRSISDYKGVCGTHLPLKQDTSEKK